MVDLAELKIPRWLATVDTARISELLTDKVHAERWKYTKVAPILELISAPGIGTDLDHSSIDVALFNTHESGAHFNIEAADSPEAWLALCQQDQVQVINAVQPTSLPLEITHTGSALPLVINVGANVDLEIIERTYSNTETNTDANTDQHRTLWLNLADNSHVKHSRNDFAGGIRWNYLNVEIGKNATYQLNNHCQGSKLHRQDIRISCNGSGAHAAISSAAFIDSATHLDQQVTMEHPAPHTTSLQTFHNIVANKGKVTFNGRIHIHPGANGVAAHLTNKNLGIGEQATINTKPELEIYNDDVSCSHGATVGQLDEDHLFYCRSRGIEPGAARQLLSQAFLNVCTSGTLAEEALQAFRELQP